MNATNRNFIRTLVLTLAVSVLTVSGSTNPVLAQTQNIPGYVQIHLDKVIEDATKKGDIIRIEKMDLNSIVALLDHKNHRVASAAAYALGEIRDAKAVPALVSALKSSRDHMRRIAAHALGKIGDRRAVMPLINVLCNGEQPPAVQASVIMSLGRIGDPGATHILTRLNRSSQSWLQQTAKVALLKIDSKQSFKLASANQSGADK